MEPSNILWREPSLVEFTNIELLYIHGFCCIGLSQTQTFDVSSRPTMIKSISKIRDHLKGLLLLSDQDIELIKNQEDIFDILHSKFKDLP